MGKYKCVEDLQPIFALKSWLGHGWLCHHETKLFLLTVSNGFAACKCSLIFNPEATLCAQCCLRAYKEDRRLILLVLCESLQVFGL